MSSDHHHPDTVDLRLPRRGLRWEGTRFWVIHRRREYGPFDYEWSHDLNGLRMIYQGKTFGEICGSDEFFADLKEFRLPTSVVRVATLTLGCHLYGVIRGLNHLQRMDLLRSRLVEHGYRDFLPPAIT